MAEANQGTDKHNTKSAIANHAILKSHTLDEDFQILARANKGRMLDFYEIFHINWSVKSETNNCVNDKLILEKSILFDQVISLLDSATDCSE